MPKSKKEHIQIEDVADKIDALKRLSNGSDVVITKESDSLVVDGAESGSLLVEEHVQIQDAADKIDAFKNLAEGLNVTVEEEGDDLIVKGPDLNSFLVRLDPSVWDPARSRGEA